MKLGLGCDAEVDAVKSFSCCRTSINCYLLDKKFVTKIAECSISTTSSSSFKITRSIR